jgi:hypothetical protein
MIEDLCFLNIIFKAEKMLAKEKENNNFIMVKWC